MDGFRVFMNCICMCIFAAGPMRLGDFALLGNNSGIHNSINNNLGGGVPVETLVHGDPAPAAIASAPDTPTASEHVQPARDNAIACAATNAVGSSLWRWQSTIAPNANNDNWKFGAAVSIHDRVIAIGPARDWDIGVDQGGVQLYVRAGPLWLQSAALSHPRGNIHAQFGAAVCLQHRMLLVGAPRDNEDESERGAAFLYEQVDDQWQLNATLSRVSNNDADQFGAALACDENTLVIGAPKADQGAQDSGAVEVYERDAHGWRNVATLVSNPPKAGALFGLSVAIDAGKIIVGAPGDRTDGNFSGRAFIFSRNASGWTLDTTLSCPVGGRGWFGNAVAVNQGRVLVGAPRLTRPQQTDFDARGAAFEFEHADNGWRCVSTIMPANTLQGDSFGCSLALQKQRAVFGASSDSLAGRLAGAAFAGTRLTSGAWNVERLAAPDCAEQQLAGHAVAIFGSSIVVGRLGNPEEDPAPGAVSIFALMPMQIAQQEVLTTSPIGEAAAP